MLKTSLKFALNKIGLDPTSSDEDKMLSAVKDADPFPEVNQVLSELKQDYQIAILSEFRARYN